MTQRQQRARRAPREYQGDGTFSERRLEHSSSAASPRSTTGGNNAPSPEDRGVSLLLRETLTHFPDRSPRSLSAAMVNIKVVCKRPAPGDEVKVPALRDKSERLNRSSMNDMAANHTQTHPKSNLPLNQTLSSTGNRLSAIHNQPSSKNTLSVDPNLSVGYAPPVQPARSITRNVYAPPDSMSTSEEDKLSTGSTRKRVYMQSTVDARSKESLIAHFETHFRDDRLLNIHHGIIKLLAERVHGDSDGRAASIKRIERMHTNTEFPQGMIDVEKQIYAEFNRLLAIVDLKKMSFQDLSPVVRQHIVEEISQEGSEAYACGLVAVAMTLNVPLAKLQIILDDDNNIWRTEDIPCHLRQLKAFNPNAAIDPDIPEPGAVFWACVFLKSHSLPLSLVYRYFTSQNPVLPPPHSIPASTSLAIDCANNAGPFDTPSTAISDASDSSLEWNPSVEDPVMHPWYVGRRTSGHERRRSIDYEVRKVTQECLVDRASYAIVSPGMFAGREVLDGQRLFIDATRGKPRGDGRTFSREQSAEMLSKSPYESGSVNSLSGTQSQSMTQSEARRTNPTPKALQQYYRSLRQPGPSAYPQSLCAADQQGNELQSHEAVAPDTSVSPSATKYEGRVDAISAPNTQENIKGLLSPYTSPSRATMPTHLQSSGKSLNITEGYPKFHSSRGTAAATIQSATVLQNQLDQQPMPGNFAHEMSRGSHSPTGSCEQSGLTAQLKTAAAQPNYAKQRVVASRAAINSMQEQYYNIVSPRISEERQTLENRPTPPSSNIIDPSIGNSRTWPAGSNSPAFVSHSQPPLQHTKVQSTQSPHRSPALSVASFPGLPSFPSTLSANGNTIGPVPGRITPLGEQQGAQATNRAQFPQASYNDPFVGPEISGAMGPYFKIPSATDFFTTSLPHQTRGAVYPSLSPSPMQDVPRQQHKRGDSGNLGYSGSNRSTVSTQDPPADALVATPGVANGRVDVSSVAQIADLLKKGDHNHRPRRTARGQKRSEGSSADKAGS